MIVIGVDVHKKTHTAVAVDEATSRSVSEATVAARPEGHDRLIEWAASFGEHRFALEDCRHVSGTLERTLIARGCRVTRVPPKLMAGVRRSSRTAGKSDAIDAEAVARAAIREPNLPEACLDGPERDLRRLADYREVLVAQRTALQNRLRWDVHDVDPSIDIEPRSLDRRNVLSELERLMSARESIQVEIIRDEIGRIRDLTKQINELHSRIKKMARALAAPLLAIEGCGELTAAKILGEVAGVRRFGTDAKLALHAGAAPLDASSGSQQRHRLNRTGNRQLNSALHRIALTQIRMHEPAKLYFKRKLEEGKTKREALRCLKRHVARRIFNTLTKMEPNPLT